MRTLTAWLCLILPLSLAAEAPFRLPDLPYPPDALEPAIDRRTMEIHHQNHHGSQVANLNAQAEQIPELAQMTVEQILAQVSKYPAAVRNNAGGHYNHSLFWTVMAPPGRGGAPKGELLAAIEREFGSLDEFRKQFSAAAAQRFGSGWAWLIVRDGRLQITSTPNQDNPLMDVVEVRGTPILGLDVWEHAYYLKYQYRRGDYIAAWWDVVDWAEVERRYAAALAQ